MMSYKIFITKLIEFIKFNKKLHSRCYYISDKINAQLVNIKHEIHSYTRKFYLFRIMGIMMGINQDSVIFKTLAFYLDSHSHNKHSCLTTQCPIGAYSQEHSRH